MNLTIRLHADRLYRAALRKQIAICNFSTFNHFFGSPRRQVKRGVSHHKGIMNVN